VLRNRNHEPNLVGHVCQELRFTPVRQLGSFPSSRVLLDAVSQVEDHLVDLGLQGIHLPTGFDSDETSEVPVHGCSGNLTEASHLGRQVAGHRVDGHSVERSVQGLGHEE